MNASLSVVDRLLKGAIDLHCHPGPSPFPRRIDIVQAARMYEAAGFAAFVAKSHHHSTATDVISVREAIADLTVTTFGGIALNGSVGGLNPRAVNLCIEMGGKVVWLPTLSSHNHICACDEGRIPTFPIADFDLMPELPISPIGEDGSLLPEVNEIITLVKNADVVLASGHLSGPEVKAVFEAAHRAGHTKLLVTHPNFVLDVDYATARDLVELGAVIEHSIVMYQPAHEDDQRARSWPLDVLLEWIEAVGVEHTSLGSDMGQKTSPLPIDGFRRICSALLDAGISDDALRIMVRDNPARLLGLESAVSA